MTTSKHQSGSNIVVWTVVGAVPAVVGVSVD